MLHVPLRRRVRHIALPICCVGIILVGITVLLPKESFASLILYAAGFICALFVQSGSHHDSRLCDTCLAKDEAWGQQRVHLMQPLFTVLHRSLPAIRFRAWVTFLAAGVVLAILSVIIAYGLIYGAVVVPNANILGNLLIVAFSGALSVGVVVTHAHDVLRPWCQQCQSGGA